MADTYSPSLRLEEQTIGANENTWGGIYNATILMIEEAIAGRVSIALAGNLTLTTANNADDQARNALIDFTGTPGVTCTVTMPDVEKLTCIKNDTGDASSVILKTGSGGNVSLKSGYIALISTDGAGNATALYNSANPLGIAGTTTTVLHGNAAGPPTFSAVSLIADVTGTLPTANGGTGLANGDVLVSDISFVIDGGGSAITTGVKGYLPIDFSGNITQVTQLADRRGNITVNIWKTSYANFDGGVTHPVVGDKITASAPPTIGNTTKAQDSTLTGWTTAFAAGDILGFNVDSADTIQRDTITLKVTKS